MKRWYELSGFLHGIPVSRYISSWYIAGGDDDFQKVMKWLKSLIINGEKLDDEEINELAQCIVNGMLELQESAKEFV